MRASSPEMLQVMTPQLTVDPLRSRAESKIFLGLSTDGAIDRALKKFCTRVSVEILFPRNIKEYGALDVKSLYRGDIQIDFDQGVALNQLFVETKEGNVGLSNTITYDELNVEARTGSIDATASVNNTVRLRSSSGLKLELNSTSSYLDVRATSLSDHANVVL
ncbi:hypothetical protein BGZ49_006305, partial [Haplosporangium sp. Z 27]